MPDTQENQASPAILPISDTVRRVAHASAKCRKVPKMGLERILDGRADSEPLMQSYACLEQAIQEEHAVAVKDLNDNIAKLNSTLKSLKDDLDEASTGWFKMRNRALRLEQTLYAIIKRAAGSIFGKGAAITKLANDALLASEDAAK